MLGLFCLIAQRLIQSPSGDEEIRRAPEGTPQRRTQCIPKTMNNGGIRTSHQEHGGCSVSTIASLVENYGEDDVSHCEDTHVNFSEALSHTSQPQKHTLTVDGQEITDTNTDSVVPRPAKRRRKLIVRDILETSTPKQQQEEQEATVGEEVATPVGSLRQKTEEGDNVVEEQVKSINQFLTSTPNDIAGSSVVDGVSTFVTPLTHHHYKRRRVLRREPAGAHVTVTASDGSRVFLRVTEESVLQDKINKQKKRYQLLSVPFYQLRHEVEAKVWYLCDAIFSDAIFSVLV